MSKYSDFLKKLCFGLVIGIASITPGLSGGVIAAAAGLYEPSIYAVVNLVKRKEFVKSVKFLFPLGIGGVTGVFLFSRVMEMLMLKAQFSVLYVFLGLVAGSIPALLKEANTQGFKKRYLICTVITFSAVMCTEYFLAQIPPREDTAITIPLTIFCGAVLAFGTIVPGISSSFIMMYLGTYQELLNAINTLNIKILALAAAGFVVTALLIIKLVEILFKKYHAAAYYSVLGFLLGSGVMIFPGFRNSAYAVLDIFLFVLSTVGSFFALRLSKRD